jgi:hypothetical protein
MEALQREIEDERKSRLTNIPYSTGVGSLGCWGSPTGLATGIVFAALSKKLAHEPVRILDIPVPALSGERLMQEVANRPWQDTRPSRRGFRERELEWRRSHAMELRQYENQWVVLEGEEIIAHSADAAQAIKQARSRGIRTPYVFFVEPQSDNSIRMGL